MLFPWRFLIIITFFVCFVAGGVLLIFKERKIRFILGVLILIFTLFWNIRYCHPLEYTNFKAFDPLKFLYLNTPSDSMELMPKMVNRILAPQILIKKLIFMTDDAHLDYQHKKGLDYTFTLSTRGPTGAVFFSYYFPGWEVYVDHEKAELIDNDYGLIEFPIEPGEHTVLVHFGSTPIRDTADKISWVAILILFLMGAYTVCRRLKRRPISETPQNTLIP